MAGGYLPVGRAAGRALNGRDVMASEICAWNGCDGSLA